MEPVGRARNLVNRPDPGSPLEDSTGESGPAQKRTGIIALSRGGVELAGRLAGAMPGDVTVHLIDRYAEEVSSPPGASIETFVLPLRPVISQAFGKYQQLILLMPVGAAVRLLSPLLQHKHSDPAVVCVDDGGRFAVSLLSGHVGGGDELTENVAVILGATAVITSASYVRETLAVDLLGRELGWKLEADSTTVTRVSASVINGEPVGVFQEVGERDWWPGERPFPQNLTSYTSLKELYRSECVAALIITDRDYLPGRNMSSLVGDIARVVPLVIYRPKSLVVGMGCRRGVSREHLEELLTSTFRKHNLSLKCIKCIATADIKRDEAGILELAGKYDVPVVCYGPDQLNDVFQNVRMETLSGVEGRAGESPVGTPTRSTAAHRLLGVWGVSEPAALLASGSSELLVTREKTDRATVAVARVPNW